MGVFNLNSTIYHYCKPTKNDYYKYILWCTKVIYFTFNITVGPVGWYYFYQKYKNIAFITLLIFNYYLIIFIYIISTSKTNNMFLYMPRNSKSMFIVQINNILK